MILSKNDFEGALSILPSLATLGYHKGKVRDVYNLKEQRIALIASDRISAFDVILPRPIPYKGQILSEIASQNFEWVKDICPIWYESSPHPNISIGKSCEVIPIEVVVRAYLTGHAWRTYKSGLRTLCGVSLKEGMKEHQAFEKPIITPATKAAKGHDEDISEEEIIHRNIVSKDLWGQITNVAYKLFERGTQKAAERGLILVDTKYEFGLWNGQLHLIDEVHTPDSSRYFYSESYQKLFQTNQKQKQLSKEFVREWLLENDFMGKDGQQIPEMTDEDVQHIFNRYVELFNQLMGKEFAPTPTHDFEQKMHQILGTELLN